MMQQMTARERNLAIIVGTLVIGLASVMLSKTFLRNYRQLKSQLTQKTAMLSNMKTLITERELWVERDQILTSNQPKLENAGSAGVNFLEELQNVAKQHNVMVDQPSIGIVQSTNKNYQSVNVKFETKSSGSELVEFLRAAQGPTKFTVFTLATIEVAKNDPTQMQGKFTVERWFAPK